MPLSLLPGIVLKAQSGFFNVRTAPGDFVCHLRGRLKQRRQRTDLIAVGDRVLISTHAAGKGMIEEITPRHSALSRQAPSGYGPGSARHSDGETEQVIVANVDQLVLVFACAEPAPHLRMLDHFLVIAESEQLPALICANKSDLASPAAAQGLFGLYAPLGYRVHYTSVTTGAGLTEFWAQLRGKLSVFTGPSGVGKSSLLNTLQPGLGIKARAVSPTTAQGRHTTVHPELFPLREDTFVADTPGLRTLDLWDIEPEELDGYFVEMQRYIAHCAFNNCTHLHEPDCAVRQAVEQGGIAPSRYESYCRLRVGDF